MKVLVSGASGLIGSELVSRRRERGDDVVSLVRREPRSGDEVAWDPAGGQLDQQAVEGFDAVIHLAGAGIADKRWSESRRRLITESRKLPTALLAERLASATDKPDVFISASAIGFYGSRTHPVDESSGPADPLDFYSKIVVDWEAATRAADDAGIRTVHIRSGIVLTDKGGALAKLLIPFRFGFGGRLGDGAAWWSWITLDDEISAIKFLIDTPLEGAVNLTSPNPVTNADLTKALGEVLSRPTFFPVPRFALHAVLGKDLAEALLFTSVRVLPTKLTEAGFAFNSPEIEPALRSILDRSGEKQ